MIQINFAAITSRLQTAAKADWAKAAHGTARSLAKPAVALYVAGERALGSPKVQVTVSWVRTTVQRLLRRNGDNL